MFVLHCKTLYIYTMTENKDNKNTTITFRTSEELKKKLEAMAAKEHRTLSNYIEYLLEKAAKEKK
jgi:predicted HicB family RNase H-like nuclease